MLKLQEMNECEKTENKYEQIIEYLKQDNEYWLNNDKWDFTDECFYGKLIGNSRYINFSFFQKETIKNEIKYFVLKNFKEELCERTVLLNISYRFKYIAMFLNEEYKNITSFWEILNKTKLQIKWNSFLLNKTKIKAPKSISICSNSINVIYDFVHEYYEDLDEVQKDIWNVRNIKGAKLSASIRNGKLNFTAIPSYYREDIKRYFSTVITRKSYGTCSEYLSIIKFFFNIFYDT